MTTHSTNVDIDAYMHAHVLRSVTSDFWQVEADSDDIMLHADTVQLDPFGAIEMAAALIALAAVAEPDEEDQETWLEQAGKMAHLMRQNILQRRHLDIRELADDDQEV